MKPTQRCHACSHVNTLEIEASEAVQLDPALSLNGSNATNACVNVEPLVESSHAPPSTPPSPTATAETVHRPDSSAAGNSSLTTRSLCLEKPSAPKLPEVANPMDSALFVLASMRKEKLTEQSQQRKASMSVGTLVSGIETMRYVVSFHFISFRFVSFFFPHVFF
jgi:hypothetical protein